ncbi:MAG: RNase adapter RapZ [Gammaproteobacteria bacterium]|nr:RNase adapter RapZ [Gammaproteobacteria bacterium]
MKLLIITGLSGSGKSIALNTLEDLGYYCIDNLPLFLLGPFAKNLTTRKDNHFQCTAVGIDARTPEPGLTNIKQLLEPLKAHGIEYQIIFLEAQNETLIKRFSETRRRHPLTEDNRPLAEAITYEQELLTPLRSSADLRVDTTHTNIHQLRHLLRERLGGQSDDQISLLFQSFGFKHGVPPDADFVFDARCLPNPHWQKELRPLTGRDRPVAKFLETDQRVQEMKQDIINFMTRWIPHFQAEGRSYLTVAIGCTGGQHRSVYLVEQLTSHFNQTPLAVTSGHRELS